MFEAVGQELVNAGGLFTGLGGVMLAPVKEEASGIRSTINRNTTYLDSPAVLPSLQSGWDAREILQGNTTVYKILPPAHLIAQSRLLRLWIASLLRLIGQHGMAKGKECLFLLDEAGQFGHMEPLESGLTLLRSYGVRLAFFFQSLGQLKECFREKEAVLLDNCDTQLFFGINGYETAERVSKLLGTYSEVARSYSGGTSYSRNVGGFGENTGGSVSESESVSIAIHQRSLLNPDEVIHGTSGLGVICFLKGLRPVFCRRVLYYSDPLFVFRRFQRLRQVGKRLLLLGDRGAVRVFVQPQVPHERRCSVEKPQEQPKQARSLAELAASVAGRAVAAVGDKIKEGHMQQPSLVGQGESLLREAAKDINSTLQEVFFGKPAGPNELGTPLSPTQLAVNSDLTGKSLDDLRGIAAENAARASQEMEKPSKDRGMEM